MQAPIQSSLSRPGSRTQLDLAACPWALFRWACCLALVVAVLPGLAVGAEANGEADGQASTTQPAATAPESETTPPPEADAAEAEVSQGTQPATAAASTQPVPTATAARKLLAHSAAGKLWLLRDMPSLERVAGAPKAGEPSRPADVELLLMPPRMSRELIRAGRFQGEVTAGSLAAGPHKAWIMFRSGLLQSAELTRHPVTEAPLVRFRVEPQRPRSGQAVALTATRAGLWLLMRPNGENPDQEPDSGQEPSAGDQPPRDQLWHLHRARWHQVPLPASWPHGSRAWLSGADDDQPLPLLLANQEPSQPDQPDLVVYRPAASAAPAADTDADAGTDNNPDADTNPDTADAAAASQPTATQSAQPTASTNPKVPPGAPVARRYGTATSLEAPQTPANAGRSLPKHLQGPRPWWQPQRHRLGLTPHQRIRAIVLDGQLVLGWPDPDLDQRLRVQLHLVRPDTVQPLPALELDVSPSRPWALVGRNGQACLIAQPGKDRGPDFIWSRINLQGETLGEAGEPLNIRSPRLPLGPDMALLGVVLVLVVVTVIIVTSRPTWLNPKLPEDTIVAPVGTRVVAGLIDVTPCVLLTLMAFDIGFMELLNRLYLLPAGSVSWSNATPLLFAVGLLVLHTSLSEALSQASLGKLLMRLRVTDMGGDKPVFWQVLLRGALKSVELLLFPLLIWVAFHPHNQRLGDLLAQTLVVAPKPEAEPEDDED